MRDACPCFIAAAPDATSVWIGAAGAFACSLASQPTNSLLLEILLAQQASSPARPPFRDEPPAEARRAHEQDRKVPRAIALRIRPVPVASWAVPSGREAEQEHRANLARLCYRGAFSSLSCSRLVQRDRCMCFSYSYSYTYSTSLYSRLPPNREGSARAATADLRGQNVFPYKWKPWCQAPDVTARSSAAPSWVCPLRRCRSWSCRAMHMETD